MSVMLRLAIPSIRRNELIKFLSEEKNKTKKRNLLNQVVPFSI